MQTGGQERHTLGLSRDELSHPTVCPPVLLSNLEQLGNKKDNIFQIEAKGKVPFPNTRAVVPIEI